MSEKKNEQVKETEKSEEVDTFMVIVKEGEEQELVPQDVYHGYRV